MASAVMKMSTSLILVVESRIRISSKAITIGEIMTTESVIASLLLEATVVEMIAASMKRTNASSVIFGRYEKFFEKTPETSQRVNERMIINEMVML